MTQLILVGGFLGAGKTTLLLTAARRLTARGLKVGLVTNDQGDDLVDTALAQQQRLAVTEVAGGCFCCRFPDLLKGLETLQRTVEPDVILAEPVGSCTDLLATVVRPLRHYHAGRFRIAPLTILIDPLRNHSRFAAEVDYLFQQQLAEAEVVVLAKQDLPAAVASRKEAQALVQRHGAAPVFALSATTGEGVDAWLDFVLTSTSAAARTLDIDYNVYAAGEAALGWLNAGGVLTARQGFSPRNWVAYLLRMLDTSLAIHGAEIAHIKAYARTADADYKASLTQSHAPVSWDLDPDDRDCTVLEFVLNARVQVASEVLASVVRGVFAELSPYPDFACTFTQFDCFRPAAPRPTYRMETINQPAASQPSRGDL
ncbi:GTP-binding protein [Caldilinea sp.]|uniref:GTP-binding protein n=1 Tax=Caldilinea sp. TaxID=2293560 RepID=UPI002BCF827B|nr:GTP-binding protein [Caldilinea sp.]HRA64928.1 GTP-binding protein [Caldilinea sp.]